MAIAVDWPAPTEALAAGREFLLSVASLPRVVVACHSDADGLCSGLLAARAVERLGCPEVHIIPSGKGENVHGEPMRRRIRALSPSALIVTDMGSRGEEIMPSQRRLPTLLIDHHQPRGLPPHATIVSAHAHEPVASSSLLVYELGRPLIGIDDLDWLALVGTVGDLGSKLPFGDEWALALRKYGQKNVTETVALLNAARRSGQHEVGTALEVLRAAGLPRDIAAGFVPGVDVLRRCRDEVQAELAKALRVAPKFAGRCALLLFSSPAQIHPLIATRWCRTLKKFIVIAANTGYLPDHVNFSARTATGVNLVEWLAALMPHTGEGEFGHGHPQASGGSLPPHDFERLLRAIGFTDVPAVQ